MNKVLIITYHFPPFRTGGVYRHQKFVKYLRSFGWDPFVITVRNPDKKIIDPTLISDLPENLTVYRTYSIDLGGLRNMRFNTFVEREYKSCNHPPEKTYISKFIAKLLNTGLLFPDDKVGWLPHTVVKARKIMKEENISVVCTTSPPHSTHLIGLALKRLVDFKWIADFRDPWMFSFMKKKLYESIPYRMWIEKTMEKRVIRSADMLIYVTDGIKNAYVQEYGEVLNQKQVVISNGYDEADFQYPINEAAESNAKFVMTYVGIVYPGKSRTFLESLRHLLDEKPDFKENSVLRFAGPPSLENMALIRELNLEEYAEMLGFRNHDRILSDMLESDLLILLVGNEKDWIPGKLFEYIRSKRPILVVGAEGDASVIAEKSGLGVRVSPHDEREIKRKIFELYLKAQNGSLHLVPNETYIAGFNRKRLTNRFAQVLNTFVVDGVSPSN